jgi:cytoskeletal protein CcmA (bactofilin family)
LVECKLPKLDVAGSNPVARSSFFAVAASRERPPLAQPSVIAAGTELTGRLTVESDLWIAGRLHGEIAIAGDLTIAAGGAVDGAVEGRAVTVAGEVRGPVYGVDRVEVVRGGVVAGDIRAACVVLGEGSEHDGRIELSD